ncbi:MAG TPA: glutamine-hydrolyzing carbamoyl-phosphate synthase small subunit [Myxococcales bacterium]|nr:glutamine-hydrolyzing carbamoyl-phosphate synthase small subunit [Myxococcales bacterium]
MAHWSKQVRRVSVSLLSGRQRAVLLLDDGSRYEGETCGATGIAVGEICFNTSMTGYQEILTDPSYAGQIITMTYPEMGNYGVNPADLESRKIHARGLIVRETSPVPSNWRATATLEEFLIAENIVAIQGVDTRALTRHIRSTGARPGVIISPVESPADEERGLEALRNDPGIVDVDMVREVTCKQSRNWTDKVELGRRGVDTLATPPYRVVAYDFGIKESILGQLTANGCEVTVVPASTTASEVLAMNPEGIFLSNGPGDPSAVHGAIDAVKELIGKLPMFGICLGHQIMALALGGRTYKLKFGHRGANQPVLDVRSGRVEITAQNHGFAVDDDSLPDGAVITHVNLNDKTVEGFEHPDLQLFSVQYHPEASPGPHDAYPHFRRFAGLMQTQREN